MKQIHKKRSPKGMSSCKYTCVGIDLDIYDWYREQNNRTRLINDLLRKRKNEEETKQLQIEFENNWCEKLECYKDQCLRYQASKNCYYCKIISCKKEPPE